MNYSVIWKIDIDAKSPKKAAQECYEMLHNGTDATCFEVTDKEGQTVLVDLETGETTVIVESTERDPFADYIKGGGVVCPFCGDGDLEGGFIETDQGRATQEIKCNTCGKAWIDEYKLAGVTR